MTRPGKKARSKPRRRSRSSGIEWPDNAVIAEVRAIRAKLTKEGGGTIEGMFKVAEERARQARARADQPKPGRKRRSA